MQLQETSDRKCQLLDGKRGKLMIKRRSSRIDIIFVFSLFFLFTILSLTIVGMGSKLFQKTAKTVESSYESQTSLSYVSNKIRYLDGEVSVIQKDETPLLVIKENIDGEEYKTIIYFHEGFLYEQFLFGDEELVLGKGEPIMQLQYFNVTQQGNMLNLEVITQNDQLSRRSIIINGGGSL